MKAFFSAFKVLKNVMGGDVVKEINTQANLGLTRISLRHKIKSGEHYVVLAELSGGNSQYVAFTVEEFGQFADAVIAIRNRLLEQTGGATS